MAVEARFGWNLREQIIGGDIYILKPITGHVASCGGSLSDTNWSYLSSQIYSPSSRHDHMLIGFTLI